MPEKSEVRVLVQQILQNSPQLATREDDVGKMGRPTFCRLGFESKVMVDRPAHTSRRQARKGTTEQEEGTTRRGYRVENKEIQERGIRFHMLYGGRRIFFRRDCCTCRVTTL